MPSPTALLAASYDRESGRRGRHEALTAYATPQERALAENAPVETIVPGREFAIGPIAIRTGRSGHVPWAASGAISPRRTAVSAIAAMSCRTVPCSPWTRCRPVTKPLVDASYGADKVPLLERATAITGLCLAGIPRVPA